MVLLQLLKLTNLGAYRLLLKERTLNEYSNIMRSRGRGCNGDWRGDWFCFPGRRGEILRHHFIIRRGGNARRRYNRTYPAVCRGCNTHLNASLGIWHLFRCNTASFHRKTTSRAPNGANDARSALLFAIAIAIHNLPEGIAAGTSFGSGEISDALSVTLGIALHNIPEGMIAIAPMLAAGISRTKTLIFALSGGIAEVIGTFLGYYAASLASALLPFSLAFAGGTMLFVIAGEMIPESQAENPRRATFSLLIGFTVMIAIGALFGQVHPGAPSRGRPLLIQ